MLEMLSNSVYRDSYNDTTPVYDVEATAQLCCCER